MKQFHYRFWFANVLIVAALLLLGVLLAGQLAPTFAGTATALLPALAIIVSTCALAFALLEAVLLYRDWKKDASSKIE